MNDLKEGDVVRLKSGGPNMTFSNKSNTGWFVCLWFKDDELKTGNFSGEDIEKVQE